MIKPPPPGAPACRLRFVGGQLDGRVFVVARPAPAVYQRAGEPGHYSLRRGPLPGQRIDETHYHWTEPVPHEELAGAEEPRGPHPIIELLKARADREERERLA